MVLQWVNQRSIFLQSSIFRIYFFFPLKCTLFSFFLGGGKGALILIQSLLDDLFSAFVVGLRNHPTFLSLYALVYFCSPGNKWHNQASLGTECSSF